MSVLRDTRKAIRTFDAFPKRPSVDQVRSERGATSTLLTYFCIIFLIWVEFGGYIDGYINYRFSVDPMVRQTINLNVDIIVAMPCKYLDANVRDSTDDRFLCEELLNFEGIPSNIPERYFKAEKKAKNNNIDNIFGESMEAEFLQKGLRTNIDLPYCRISGILPINRVQGDFHITAEGNVYFGKERTTRDQMNFSHYINEFSFGTFYPFIENNLDMTYKKTEEKLHTFHYSLKVIPTDYLKLGACVETTQYSVASFETNNKYASGIFFKYDFEPIKMAVIEERMPFFQFLIKVITIVGSIWVFGQWLYKALEKFILVSFGEQVARRGQEKKKGGLLDKEDDLESI